MKIESQDFYYFLTSSKYITNIWDKVFKNGPSKICGRQPSNFKFPKISNFLKAVFHKFYLVHS